MKTLDATPTQTSGRYGVEFLRDKGQFGDPVEFTDNYDDDAKITYLCTNRIAYFEGVEIEKVSDIVTGLKRRRNFDFYWFWEPDQSRVEVLRSFGENKQFIYNPDAHTGETKKSKQQKLQSIDTEGLTKLFDIKDVTDRFYTDLWDHRLDLAETIQDETDAELGDQTALLSAQRTIDRLIFTYFLAEKGVILGVAPNGRISEVDPQELFSRILEEVEDFGSFLQTLFHDRLNQDDQNTLTVADGFSLYVPYLNGGLFRDRKLSSADGSNELFEKELDLAAANWEAIIGELNEYNWLLEDYDVDTGIDRDVRGTLTPEILGSIYERFVITVSEVSDLSLESLRETFQGDVKQMQQGNRDIGAYYTPEDVVEHIITYCLWEYLNEQVPETSEYDSFTDFYDSNRKNSELLAKVEQALGTVTVCDPGVGSGHFLLALADKLEDWRLKAGYDDDLYELRKEIVLENLYGVDVLEGAADICQLRMWLWLVGGQDLKQLEAATELSDLTADEQVVDPLPNVDYNIRAGNSLHGFTTNEIVVDGTKILVTQNLQSDIEEYRQKINEVKDNHSNVGELQAEIDEIRSTTLPKINDRFANYLNSYFHQEAGRERRLHFEDGEDLCTKAAQIGDSSHFVKISSRDALSDDLLDFLDSSYKKTAKNNVATDNIDALAELIDKHDTDRFKEAYIECDAEADEFGDDGEFSPVHWIFEFPDVFKGENSGFDIVVGNPPYGDDVLGQNDTELLSTYASSGCGDIAGYFLEREIDLLHDDGIIGNVIAASILVNKQMTPVRDHLRETVDGAKVSFFGIRPSKIFDTVDERVSLVLGQKDTADPDGLHTSRNIRFTSDQRKELFNTIEYDYTDDLLLATRLGHRQDKEKERPPKVGRTETREVLLTLKDVANSNRDLKGVLSDSGTHELQYRASGRYWLQSLDTFPLPARDSTMVKSLHFDSDVEKDFTKIALNSSLFYLFWSAYGNNRHLQKTMMEKFPIPKKQVLDEHANEIADLATQLEQDLKGCYDPNAGTVGEFDPAKIRDTIDSLDDFLGTVYGLEQPLIQYVTQYDSHLRS